MAHLRGRERARYVARMFARISGRYDLLNTVMSAGRHHAWRRLAADMATGDVTGPALDVATGTGDFALELASKPTVTSVVGLDFTPEMLPVAIRKLRKRRRGRQAHKVRLVMGDADALPFPDRLFACATVGFGVRNFVDLPQALREIARVLRPGGRVAVLEIVPGGGSGLLAWLFPVYFGRVVPWLGGLLAGDREAYTYLPESVEQFSTAGELATLMEEAGLRNVAVRSVALGTVSILVGEKAAWR